MSTLHHTTTVLDDDARRRVAVNLRTATDVAAWLDRLGLPDSDADYGRLCADLSDLYVVAGHYQRLLDALLSDRGPDREQTLLQLAETSSELRHGVSHARTAIAALERLACRLDADAATLPADR